MAASPSEDAMRARIISHMNNDHQDSLVRYLEHYLSMPSYTARDAKLEAVSLNGMTVSASGVLRDVPFSGEPLESLAEMRSRVVAMDEECRKALGRSDVTVKRYVPPQGIGAIFAGVALWTLITTSRRENFQSGSLLYDNLYKHVPTFAQLNYTLAPYVWWSIVVLHGLEAIFIMRPSLKKHSVPTGSRLWWTWLASGFFLDGIGTIMRFKQLVKSEQEKKDKAAH